jgi:short-subunit dehydrogenase
MPYAIITGATEGMGKAIAEKLLSEGFSIAICARTESRLTETKAAWNEKYPAASVVTFRADLSKKEDVQAFADAVFSAFPEIDVLVNNAGTFVPGKLSTEPDGLLEEMLNLNLFAAYHLTRRILPRMKERNMGHIFNTCSVAGLDPHPGSGAYSISKYAMRGFSENLRAELKSLGIKVTTIFPGSTKTHSWDGETPPPGTLMEASDIAAMIWSAYQLSPDASVESIVLRPVKP